MQPANFDFDPVDVFSRRMVEIEKALDYFGGDVFGCVAQSRSTPLLLS
jgi:hypothetical protein